MLRRGMAGFLVVFVVLALVPTARDTVLFPISYLVLIGTIMFWAAQATSWNILSGYSGYFSFGQSAFVGLGAYTSAILAGRLGISYLWTIPVAAVLSVALALVVGGLAFRLRAFRGEVFALLTLAVPFILASFARINTSIDGGQGIVVAVPSYPKELGEFQEFVYLLNLAGASLAVAIAFAMQHSRFGWALSGIRDAEEVAEGLGVPTFRYKMLAIATMGLLAGLGGAVFALQIGFVTVEGVFGLEVPLFVIVMSVLGGRAHWLGPVIGAVAIVMIRDRLVSSGLAGWNPIILGAILAGLVIVAPEGLYARYRARARWSVAAFALPIACLAIFRAWGGPIEWLLVGMLASAVVALWPRRLGRWLRNPGLRRARVDAVPVRPSVALTVSGAGPAGEASGAASGAASGQWSGALGPGLGDAPAPVVTAARPTEPGAASPIASIVGGDSPAVAAGPTDAPLIECIDITREFGGVRALRRVTLTIGPGELVGLVGPNGSGKTTLVNLMSGALRPTGGIIRIAGRPATGLAPHRFAHMGVARTYQIPRPFESITVRDNVAMAIMFGRDPHSLEAARVAAVEHLELVGLAGRAGALPTEINLHERQLLEMARAVATRPKVLLLDEALAGLNPVEIDNAVAVVRRIHASGIAVVIVEHLLRVVNQLATRVVVLDQGLCLADGEPQAVMRDPDVVRAYLGSQFHA